MTTQAFFRETRRTHPTQFTSQVSFVGVLVRLPMLTGISYGSMGECGELYPVQLRRIWDGRQVDNWLGRRLNDDKCFSDPKGLWIYPAESWLGFQPQGGAPKRIESMYPNRSEESNFRLLHR